jgi:hypothetical protein
VVPVAVIAEELVLQVVTAHGGVKSLFRLQRSSHHYNTRGSKLAEV